MKAKRGSSRPVVAWHFVGNTLRDGRPVPADGEMLRFDGVPTICESGLHASRDPFDALKYAPGPILCRVLLGGTILDDGDILVGTERTIIARIDATELLRYFARMQAVSVLHLWKKDPPDAVLDYLMTGDNSLRAAARVAASASSSTAAWVATWAAVSEVPAAARNAVIAAAHASAEAAALAAVSDVAAAWAKAWAKAKSAARADFNARVDETFS